MTMLPAPSFTDASKAFKTTAFCVFQDDNSLSMIIYLFSVNKQIAIESN